MRTKPPQFLRCCPWWLLSSAAVTEAAGYAFESGNGNLAAFFAGGNIPVALRDAIRRYDYGYQSGLVERRKREQRKRDSERSK